MKSVSVQEINISDYDYELPDERIARYPVEPRDSSKLLHYRTGEIGEYRFFELPQLLTPGDLMVCNNTKVIQARLLFKKDTGAKVEVFCLEPFAPADYALAFQATGHCVWRCLIGNARRWKGGDLHLTLRMGDRRVVTLTARRVAADDETRGGEGADAMSHLIGFEWDDERLTWAEILDGLGQLPIPPYLGRPTEERDKVTYQTVYSKQDGSVAAPTAGLHFTREVLDAIASRGVAMQEVTLHVGAGTFQPVKAEAIGEHPMHRETIEVRRETVTQLLRHLGRITAVGTTSVRTLESLYFIGCHIMESPEEPDMTVRQWEPYDVPRQVSTQDALQAIADYMDRNGLTALHAATRIIIVPSYRFRLVDKLITNFHQPHSTLLLLVSAFVGGDAWRRIYDYAMGHEFRFLSYGDSSLLER